MSKTMQEPRRGSQLGPWAEHCKCLEEELCDWQDLGDVEVRLRRTFHLIWLPPSCAHLRWACMVFSIKVESSTRPASSRHKSSPWFKTSLYLSCFQIIAANYMILWQTLMVLKSVARQPIRTIRKFSCFKSVGASAMKNLSQLLESTKNACAPNSTHARSVASG